MPLRVRRDTPPLQRTTAAGLLLDLAARSPSGPGRNHVARPLGRRVAGRRAPRPAAGLAVETNWPASCRKDLTAKNTMNEEMESLERALLMRMLEDTLGLALAMAKIGNLHMARLELADAVEKLNQIEALEAVASTPAALAPALEV